jgi:hypothetical protein
VLAVNKHNNGKASGDDEIINEYLKRTVNQFLPIYVKLLNLIYSYNWSTVTLIFLFIPFFPNLFRIFRNVFESCFDVFRCSFSKFFLRILITFVHFMLTLLLSIVSINGTLKYTKTYPTININPLCNKSDKHWFNKVDQVE